jgi:hypothetical protein
VRSKDARIIDEDMQRPNRFANTITHAIDILGPGEVGWNSEHAAASGNNLVTHSL